jgi:hypothetical protein
MIYTQCPMFCIFTGKWKDATFIDVCVLNQSKLQHSGYAKYYEARLKSGE